MYEQDNSSFYNLMNQVKEADIKKQKKIYEEMGLDKNNCCENTWANTGKFDLEDFKKYINKYLNTPIK